MKERPVLNSSESEAPKGPSLLKRAVRIAAAALFVIAVGLAGALLWRPSPARTAYPALSFAETFGETDIAAAGVELPVYGSSRVVLTDFEIGAMAAAALRRDDPSVPPGVAEAVSEAVPAWIEAVAGCEIHPDRQAIYLRGRILVTFYITVCGRLKRLADDSLVLEIIEVKLGLVPLPIGLAPLHPALVREGTGPPAIGIIETAIDSLRVKEFAAEEGRITLKVEEELQ